MNKNQMSTFIAMAATVLTEEELIGKFEEAVKKWRENPKDKGLKDAIAFHSQLIVLRFGISDDPMKIMNAVSKMTEESANELL